MRVLDTISNGISIDPPLPSNRARAQPQRARNCRPYGEPEDIAEVATFMLELKGNFLLGHILYVDGGTESFWRPDRL